MPITIEWDDSEKTIIRYTYQGKWTWEENDQISAQSVAFAKEVDHPLDVIIDFRNSHLLPERALSRFRDYLTPSDKTMSFQTAVLVFQSEFLARMLEIFSRLYSGVRGKIHSATSVEEAREIIIKARAARMG